MTTTPFKWYHRPPRIKDMLKAQQLRKKGLTIRAISWAILKREDPKTIHRWLGIDVGKTYPGVINTL